MLLADGVVICATPARLQSSTTACSAFLSIQSGADSFAIQGIRVVAPRCFRTASPLFGYMSTVPESSCSISGKDIYIEQEDVRSS